MHFSYSYAYPQTFPKIFKPNTQRNPDCKYDCSLRPEKSMEYSIAISTYTVQSSHVMPDLIRHPESVSY